jgi:hypothetical protein
MENNDDKKGMFRAYQVAQEMIKDRLEDVDEEAAKEMGEVAENEVIVARGAYDFIERVFSKMEMPHKVVDPSAFEAFGPSPEQIVFLNCPGKVDKEGVRNLRNFVEKGGFLFTTDWALKHVIEPGFPGTLRYNGRATGDEVVRVEIDAKEDPFLKSLIGEGDDPQWWIEGSSYPIEILDKNNVEVLVRSKEVKEKYGESPVFTSFNHGKGKVYHMISHFYLQRTETRTERHRRTGADYMEEKLRMNSTRRAKYRRMGVDRSSLGEVEAAYSSSALMGKVMYEKSVSLKQFRDEEL